jgi:flagellum-specific peptidoglycan hydrolase FlgJ
MPKPSNRPSKKKRKDVDNPSMFFDQASADWLDHYKGAATKQEKAKAYLQQHLSAVDKSADLTAKTSKKAAKAFSEAAESQDSIAKSIEKGLKGVTANTKKAKKQASVVSALFEDLFSDAASSLAANLSYSMRQVKKVRSELNAASKREMLLAQQDADILARAVKKQRSRLSLPTSARPSASSRRGPGGASPTSSGGSGGGGNWLSGITDMFKSFKGGAGAAGKALGGVGLGIVADATMSGVQISDELSNLYRSTGTNYDNFSKFLDKLPDLIVSTQLSRKELIALTEQFQDLGVPIVNSNKNLIGFENVLGQGAKLLDVSSETMAHFGRNAYTADLSVSQLRDSIAKMYEHGSKLGLSMSNNKEAINTSIASYNQLGAVLGRTQDEMTALSQKSTQLFVAMGLEPSKALPFLTSVGTGLNRARSSQLLQYSGFGLKPGEDLMSDQGLKKLMESVLFQLASTSYNGVNLGLKHGKTPNEQRLMEQQMSQLSQQTGMDVGDLQQMFAGFESRSFKDPAIAKGGPKVIRKAVESYMNAELGAMAANGAGTKSFDQSRSDYSRTLGQIPKNAGRLAEAGQTKMGISAMYTGDQVLNQIGDTVGSGFKDVIAAINKLGGGNTMTGLTKAGGAAIGEISKAAAPYVKQGQHWLAHFVNGSNGGNTMKGLTNASGAALSNFVKSASPYFKQGQQSLSIPIARSKALAKNLIRGATGFPQWAINAAQVAEQRTGVPAAVTLAQFKLESGMGKFMPKGSNNPFGIKARKGQASVLAPTMEQTKSGHAYHTTANFAKYDTMADAFTAHANLLANPRGPYRKAIPLMGNTDKYIDAIAPIYATDHSYASKIHQIIRDNHLGMSVAKASSKVLRPTVDPKAANAIIQGQLDAYFGYDGNAEGNVFNADLPGASDQKLDQMIGLLQQLCQHQRETARTQKQNHQDQMSMQRSQVKPTDAVTKAARRGQA